MSTQYNEGLWIVWNELTKTFVKNSQRDITFDIDQANGWHYKKDAQRYCAQYQEVIRRRDARQKLGLPPIPKKLKPTKLS